MNAAATGSRAILWAVSLALSLLLLSSLFRQPLTTSQAVILACFAGLSLARPVDALLLFAAFGPFVGLAAAVLRLSFGGWLLETLVLLLLAPWIAVQARWIGSARWRALDWALLAFGAVVVASAMAHLPVIALRSGGDVVPRSIWEFFTTTYLLHPPDADVATEAAALLEGVGLCALVSRHAADIATARRITGMVIAGATAAALLNVSRLFEVALSRGPLTETIGTIFSSQRINTQFGDVNAAGSYFAMALAAAVGLANLETRRGQAYGMAAVPLAAAVWLSGSRTALAGAVLGVLGIVIVRTRERTSSMIRSRKRVLGLAAVAIAAAAALTLLPKARSAGVRYSVFARAELAATAFRMVENRPFLGVGVSRFYELFPEYASAELREAFFQAALVPVTRENAHNNFLQILAELGLVGFAAFVLVLLLALRPGDGGTHGLRPVLIVAICVFLFTALFGHPLLTHVVAYAFWIALGLAAARAPDMPPRSAAALRIATTVLVVILVALVPIRGGYEQRQANLDGVALGMSSWQRDEAGNRFRWARPHSTLFVESGPRVLRLPMQAASAACTVEIRIDGRTVDRVTIPSGIWHDVRLRLPPATDARRSHRIDLIGGGCAGAPGDAARALRVGRQAELGASGPPLPR